MIFGLVKTDSLVCLLLQLSFYTKKKKEKKRKPELLVQEKLGDCERKREGCRSPSLKDTLASCQIGVKEINVQTLETDSIANIHSCIEQPGYPRMKCLEVINLPQEVHNNRWVQMQSPL